MKKLKAIVLLPLLVPHLLLTGCDSATQPVSQAYVLSIGFDKGEEKDFSVTFQVPNLTSENDSSEVSSYAITIEAESLADAINGVNVNNPLSINMTHINMVIFGEELARDEGILGLVTSLCRFNEMNWTANVVACKGTAKDYIKGIQVETEIDLDSLQDNILATSKRSGFYPTIFLMDSFGYMLYDGTGFACMLAAGNKDATEQIEEKEGGGSEQAVMAQSDPRQESSEDKMEKLNTVQTPGEFKRTGGLGSDISGAAVIKDGKMVGELTGHEARAVMMLRDEFVESKFVITNPFKDGGLMALQVKRAKAPHIKVTIDDTPKIEVRIFLMITGFTHNTIEDYTEPGKREVFTRHANDSIKQQIDSMLENMEQYECDIFGFNKYAAKNFLSNKDFEEYNWAENYKNAEINVIVESWFLHPRLDKTKEVSE